MIEITNRLFQPLTLPASSGEGVHLPPRGRVTVSKAAVSAPMRRAAARGYIVLQPVAAAADPEAPRKTAPRKEG